MVRRPVERGDQRAEAVANAAILREALPRLLRLATDPGAEAAALLAAVERRLTPVPGTQDDVRRMVRAAIAAAVDDERTRRLDQLGTDGTP